LKFEKVIIATYIKRKIKKINEREVKFT